VKNIIPGKSALFKQFTLEKRMIIKMIKLIIFDPPFSILLGAKNFILKHTT
jgi:hypothetical protein